MGYVNFSKSKRYFPNTKEKRGIYYDYIFIMDDCWSFLHQFLSLITPNELSKINLRNPINNIFPEACCDEIDFLLMRITNELKENINLIVLLRDSEWFIEWKTIFYNLLLQYHPEYSEKIKECIANLTIQKLLK